MYVHIHSICFLPQYQRNEIFVLTIEHTDSDLKVYALYYANELLVRVSWLFIDPNFLTDHLFLPFLFSY